MMRLIKHVGFVLAFAGSINAAQSGEQPLPDTENGRYALSPIAEGVLRLDKNGGAVTTCKDNGQGWACYAMPDERAAYDAEIGRLQAENEKLRAQLAERDTGRETSQRKIDEALPKSDPLGPRVPRSAEGDRKIEIPLPSDRDMNRLMGFLEDAWRRLVDMAARIQRNTDGKI